MRRFAAVAAAFLVAVLAGCAFGRRFSAVRPGVDQVLRVENGDRIFFEMEEGDYYLRLHIYKMEENTVTLVDGEGGEYPLDYDVMASDPAPFFSMFGSRKL